MQLATTKTSVVVRSCLIVRTTYIHEDLLPRDQSTHAIPGQRSTRHLLNFISHVRRPGVPHWQPDSHRQMRPRYPLVHGSVYSQKVFSLARSCRCVEKPILPAQRTFSSVLRDQFAEWVGKVGHWLSIVQSRLRSRPGHCGGIFQPTGPGSAAPTIEVSLPSDPLSNRACGSLAHGFPTSFILRHAQLDSVWFR